jgi:hypothetical protein
MPSSYMTLRFVCPRCSQVLDCRVSGDVKSLVKRWSKPVSVHCARCEIDHHFPFRDGYAPGILAGFGCARPGSAAQGDSLPPAAIQLLQRGRPLQSGTDR